MKTKKKKISEILENKKKYIHETGFPLLEFK